MRFSAAGCCDARLLKRPLCRAGVRSKSPAHTSLRYSPFTCPCRQPPPPARRAREHQELAQLAMLRNCAATALCPAGAALPPAPPVNTFPLCAARHESAKQRHYPPGQSPLFRDHDHRNPLARARKSTPCGTTRAPLRNMALGSASSGAPCQTQTRSPFRPPFLSLATCPIHYRSSRRRARTSTMPHFLATSPQTRRPTSSA